MSTEDEVRKASQKFYAALNRMGNGEKGATFDFRYSATWPMNWGWSAVNSGWLGSR